MNFKKALQLSPTNLNQLRSLGYSNKNYYCGNWAFMPYYTFLRKKARKLGIPFPFNTCCFIHDVTYNHCDTLRQKLQADKIFLQNMLYVIDGLEHISSFTKAHLKSRAWFYYYIVRVVVTPFWLAYQYLRWR